MYLSVAGRSLATRTSTGCSTSTGWEARPGRMGGGDLMYVAQMEAETLLAVED